MKRIFLLIIIVMIQISCSTTQNTMEMEGWVGKPKKSFIKSWGTPIRTLDDEKKGEILIYADQVYANSNNQHSSGMVGSNHWDYTFVYINPDGKIASWRKEKQVFPPQQINAADLIVAKSISAK